MESISGAWTPAELAEFLEQARVPIRIGCHHSSGGLWLVSLWYRFEDDAFECATGADSALAGFLRGDDAVAFEVSTNRPPYMGVRGNGTATLAPDDEKTVLRDLLERYLGGTDSDLAATLLTEGRDEVKITIDPDRLYTWDFSARMDDAIADSPAVAGPAPDSPKDR